MIVTPGLGESLEGQSWNPEELVTYLKENNIRDYIPGLNNDGEKVLYRCVFLETESAPDSVQLYEYAINTVDGERSLSQGTAVFNTHSAHTLHQGGTPPQPSLSSEQIENYFSRFDIKKAHAISIRGLLSKTEGGRQWLRKEHNVQTLMQLPDLESLHHALLVLKNMLDKPIPKNIFSLDQIEKEKNPETLMQLPDLEPLHHVLLVLKNDLLVLTNALERAILENIFSLDRIEKMIQYPHIKDLSQFLHRLINYKRKKITFSCSKIDMILNWDHKKLKIMNDFLEPTRFAEFQKVLNTIAQIDENYASTLQPAFVNDSLSCEEIEALIRFNIRQLSVLNILLSEQAAYIRAMAPVKRRGAISEWILNPSLNKVSAEYTDLCLFSGEGKQSDGKASIEKLQTDKEPNPPQPF